MPETKNVAQKEKPIVTSLSENVAYVNQRIGVGKSWDLLAKDFHFGNLRMTSYAANGFFLTMNLVLILENLETCIQKFVSEHEPNFSLKSLVDYLNTHVAFVQVQPVPKMEDAIRFILSGPLVTFIDGFDQALMIDTRIYPMRSIDESEVERVVRGPRDGFTETMLMNTSLIRRRLRDPGLRVELSQIGTRSKTDISLMYIDGVTDDVLVDDVRKKLASVQVEALLMGEQSLVESLCGVSWNPYPVVRYTERPDVAATALMDGQLVIIVDTSPEAIVLPTSFFQHLHHPQEYHSYPLFGTYTRWVILFGVLASIFLPGVFLLMNEHPSFAPHELKFFIAEKGDPLPLWAELLIAEAALDMLRLAVINTPNALASSIGIIAALLFGQFATKIELLQAEVLVYMGFVMIAQFATPSYELGSANQLARFWIILWTAFGDIFGFGISIFSLFLLLWRTNSFGVPYLWPLVPFHWKDGLSDVVVRRPMHHFEGVPAILKKSARRRKT